MSSPKVENVHLVGSIPVSSEEESFRTVCKALPGRLRRVPDGEPGERNYFVRWQADLFKHEPRLLSESFNPGGSTALTEDQANEIVKSLPQLQTRYDDYALTSYETFKKLRDDGVIPQGIRFQVGLPTPLNVVSIMIRDELRTKVEPVYQDAIIRSLSRIQSGIPVQDLAIQWDVAMEFATLEGAAHRGEVKKSWFGPAFKGIVDRLATLGESVAEDVELGYHFCYGTRLPFLLNALPVASKTNHTTGDFGQKHFIEPRDTLTMVNVANALLAKCKRRVDYIHMPVPKDRGDREYFEPLLGLTPNLGKTGLILGLVHYDDLSGTQARIRSAGEIVKTFGVATECGMGRTPPEHLDSIFSILATVTDQENEAHFHP
jgi:hypothetical protein